ncbi:MAG: hypothetical protein HY580_00480 [Nitrospinae bacterium]|nr:hypothetical protein [Nitrospinota bacterium]
MYLKILTIVNGILLVTALIGIQWLIFTRLDLGFKAGEGVDPASLIRFSPD